MADSEEQASRIARLNEEFRHHAGLGQPDARIPPGRCVKTAGVAALGLEAQAEILARVRQFSNFDPGNDPHREHDFGVIAAPDGERVFWKIDYFADEAMEYGSEHPDDPTWSYRVLTIMLAAEY